MGYLAINTDESAWKSGGFLLLAARNSPDIRISFQSDAGNVLFSTIRQRPGCLIRGSAAMAKLLKEPIPAQRFIELGQLTLTLSLGSFACSMLDWGFYKPVWWRNHMHTHSYFEVCYAYQGQGCFHIEGVDYPVEAGQFFVAHPGKPHEIISSHDNPLGIYFWSYTLVPDSFTRPSPRGVDALLDAFINSTEYVGVPSANVLALLQMLTEEIVTKEPGYVKAVEGLIGKLILDTARSVIPTPALAEVAENLGQTHSKSLVQQLTRFLADNYDRPLNLEIIARQVNLSERQISRLFKSQTGLTIMDYLNNLRLEAASQLLMQRKLSIKEIAEATGFKDVRYFMTLFRKFSGKTAGEYRNGNGTVFLSENFANRSN